MTTDATPTEKTELQAYAEQSPANIYVLAFEVMSRYSAPIAATLGGYGVYRYMTGAIDGQTLAVMGAGLVGLVGAMSAANYMEKHYPDGLFAERKTVDLPSKEELATVKTELSDQKAEALARVNAMEASLVADKPTIRP
jgi:hypothetical protein